jgi:general secretion pathway protein K
MTPMRRGFALPAVLWVVVSASTLALLGTFAARDSVATAQNRVDGERAAWRAEGCLEEARAVMGDAIADERTAQASWNALDSVVQSSPFQSDGCVLSLVPAGVALDVNAADDEQLHALLDALGVGAARADSIVDAILDWRDADDDVRPNGAEREWYDSRILLGPRNGPLASQGELKRIRGVAEVAGLDTLLTTEPGRVVVSRAPMVVLASLPGFSGEALARVAELRARGAATPDLLGVCGLLSKESCDALTRRYSDLMQRSVTEPEAWIVTSRATSGARGVAAVVEVRVVRAGTRVAIVRRRDG